MATSYYYYPNAALSGDELRRWAEDSAAVSSRWLADPQEILEDVTRNWGKRR